MQAHVGVDHSYRLNKKTKQLRLDKFEKLRISDKLNFEGSRLSNKCRFRCILGCSRLSIGILFLLVRSMVVSNTSISSSTLRKPCSSQTERLALLPSERQNHQPGKSARAWHEVTVSCTQHGNQRGGGYLCFARAERRRPEKGVSRNRRAEQRLGGSEAGGGRTGVNTSRGGALRVNVINLDRVD